jgi:hypothetical protein
MELSGTRVVSGLTQAICVPNVREVEQYPSTKALVNKDPILNADAANARHCRKPDQSKITI